MNQDEFEVYLKTLTRVADSCNADCTLLHQRNTAKPSTTINATDSTRTGSEENVASPMSPDSTISPIKSPLTPPDSAEASNQLCFYGHALIRIRPGQVESIVELRVAVVGNVDAGKSTMLGVLTKDLLDDGRGKARVNLFRHKHEIESGRTSSVGMEIMGFDSKGGIITPTSLGKPKLIWEDICHMSSKILTFIDLAGHERYLKTTVFGMTGCAPDFVMLMIAANNGIIGMTKEHLGLALALNVPVFVVITKIDMCPQNVLEATIAHLNKILRSSGVRKIPVFINNKEDVLVTADIFVSERVCPIFQVSNVTGLNLDLLKLFLNVLHANGNGKYNVKAPVEYLISDTFSVPGVGTVVSGTITNGTVHAGDTLLLGPDTSGEFISTVVKSIQRKRVNVPVACAGQNASFALKKIRRNQLRKGMVMLAKSLNPKAVYDFEAEVLVLFHSTTIGPRYQAMVHCGCVRQTARIVGMDQQILRTGDRAIVHFRFVRQPEYLKPGARLLFREGRTKGVGKVVRLLTDDESDHPSN